jgi:hypothetical protein
MILIKFVTEDQSTIISPKNQEFQLNLNMNFDILNKKSKKHSPYRHFTNIFILSIIICIILPIFHIIHTINSKTKEQSWKFRLSWTNKEKDTINTISNKSIFIIDSLIIFVSIILLIIAIINYYNFELIILLYPLLIGIILFHMGFMFCLMDNKVIGLLLILLSICLYFNYQMFNYALKISTNPLFTLKDILLSIFQNKNPNQNIN